MGEAHNVVDGATLAGRVRSSVAIVSPRDNLFVSLAAARGGRTVATAADAAAVAAAALDLKWHYHDCIGFDIA